MTLDLSGTTATTDEVGIARQLGLDEVRALVAAHGPAVLTASLAEEIGLSAAEETATSYVLMLAHPTLSAADIVAHTADTMVLWLDHLVHGLLRDAGWPEEIAEDAAEHAVARFCGRTADLVEASPTNAGGRA